MSASLSPSNHPAALNTGGKIQSHHLDRLAVVYVRQSTMQQVEGRPGFQRLVAEVGLDHVGIVLGIEISRLARSSRDWYQLLEVCAVFATLIADADGLYDPMTYNDPCLSG